MTVSQRDGLCMEIMRMYIVLTTSYTHSIAGRYHAALVQLRMRKLQRRHIAC